MTEGAGADRFGWCEEDAGPTLIGRLLLPLSTPYHLGDRHESDSTQPEHGSERPLHRSTCSSLKWSEAVKLSMPKRSAPLQVFVVAEATMAPR